MAKADLTAQRLRELLDYDPETGVFMWKVPRRGAPHGRPAGCLVPNGYLSITIDGSYYLSHRLAWLHVTGDWPAHNIDHVNGIRADNRFANLRDVSQGINRQNLRAANADGTSGFLGVTRNPRLRDKWLAVIGISGKQQRLGSFDTPEEAYAVYLAAKRRLHAGCTI